MTYEELQKANATIRTRAIKGKDYAEVSQRIKAFRMLYPDGFITTHLVSNEGGVAVMQATVGRYEGERMIVMGTGMAYEKEGSTYINETSYIENCETSAVGRALGMLGIGVDTAVASAEEVENAIANQEKKPAKPATASQLSIIKAAYSPEQAKQIAEYFKHGSIDKLTIDEASTVIKKLEKKK